MGIFPPIGIDCTNLRQSLPETFARNLQGLRGGKLVSYGLVIQAQSASLQRVQVHRQSWYRPNTNPRALVGEP
jgi:hypothetical protein